MVFQLSVSTARSQLNVWRDVLSREFFYSQIEKYARQYLAEGVRHVEDLLVTPNSDLYRILNLHYNRSNQIDVGGGRWRFFDEHGSVSLGSSQFRRGCSSDAARILPRHSTAERSGIILEEKHLQGDPTIGRSNSRIFQTRALDAFDLNSRTRSNFTSLSLSLSLMSVQ